jgi:hypothetical protein
MSGTEHLNIKFADGKFLKKVYGKAAMKKTQAYRCHKHSCYGCESVSENVHCRRPANSTGDENINHVHIVAK